MSNTAAITVRANRVIKKKAQEYFDSLGISMSAAINMFLNDVVSNKSMSFSIADEPFGTLYALDHSNLSPNALRELNRVEELNEDELHTITVENYEHNQS
jgi:addiction module RelB/DinJ family antitoxin